MRIGTAWEDITPRTGLPLMGQMHVRLAESVHDPLTVNAVSIEDGARRAAVVSVDVCVLRADLIEKMKEQCASVCGIDADSVLIAATHSHVAPCTTDRLVGQADPGFLARLVEATGQAVKRAIGDAEDVHVFAGSGYLEHMGWNRRGLRRDGACHMYWGSWCEGFVGLEGPRDGEVGVIFARRQDGSVKMVMTSFSTHPNCLEGERFYSADVPGEVRRVLRAVLGQDLGVVYLTGAAGNTAPSIMQDNPQNHQPWRGEAGLRRSGQYLGAEILKVIAGRTEPLTDASLRLESRVIDIPIRPWDEGSDLSGFGGGMLRFFEESRANWDTMVREESPVETRLSVLRIGDAAICFNPAELYCEFGLAMKERSPARTTLVAELTDGWIGYVPTPQAVRHGGYSAQSSAVTKLVPEAGWLITETTGDLLRRAFAASG